MPQASAAPVTVLSAGAVEYVITRLARHFESTTGTPVELTFRTIAGVRKLLAEGRTADIVIGTSAAIAEMEAAGTLVAGTRVEIGSTSTGICVRLGAPLPDISTRERLREVLLAARSVAYSDPKVGGSSGIYLVKLMDGMGILADVERKSVLCKNGEDIVKAVAAGQAEVGSTFVSEFLLAGGIASAGEIPAAFGNKTAYAAALLASGTGAAGSGGSGRDIARLLLAMMTAPEHRTAWVDGGFEPAGRGRGDAVA